MPRLESVELEPISRKYPFNAPRLRQGGPSPGTHCWVLQAGDQIRAYRLGLRLSTNSRAGKERSSMRGMRSKAAAGRASSSSFDGNRLGWTAVVSPRQNGCKTGGRRRCYRKTGARECDGFCCDPTAKRYRARAQTSFVGVQWPSFNLSQKKSIHYFIVLTHRYTVDVEMSG
jgi:hypothetical protein